MTAAPSVPARTHGEILSAAASRLSLVSDDARLEAQVLLAHVSGTSRTRLLARLADPIEPPVEARLAECVSRRLERQPLAYIVGSREFYGAEFACGTAALIPRPETEMLVEIGLQSAAGRADVRILDVGTGTGAVAVAIALRTANATLVATDVSNDALELARRNVAKHRVQERIHIVRADLLFGLGVFDVILANLPYVSEGDWRALAPEVRDHEPRQALVGGPRGPELVERLLREAPGHLAADAVVACEIGYGQGETVRAVACSAFPKSCVSVERDLAGLDRVVVVRRETR